MSRPIAGLFVDSCIEDVLDSGETEFGAEMDQMFRDLDALLMEIDDGRPQEKVIADPKMAKVEGNPGLAYSIAIPPVRFAMMARHSLLL